MAFRFQPSVVTNGLVLYVDAGNVKSYPGSGTTWTDLSSTQTTGSLVNGPTFSSNINGAILFDGTNDYVDFGNVLSFERTSPFTISTWFRTSRAGSFTSTMVGKQKLVVSPADYSGYQVGMNTVSASSAEAGKFGFSMVSSPFTSVATNVIRKQTSASYNNDTWVNGVVTYDGSSNRSGILIYMNGVSVLTEDHDASSLSLSITSSVNFEIGARDGTQQPFTGSIGQVQIYNRALSATEVLQNYNAICGRFGKTPTITDGDALNFVNSANISSETQQSAINTLVTDLKGAGLWTKMKAIYPMAGGTATSHKWNLKDPRDVDAAFRLSFLGGWTHSSTGALPNGTTGYADTFLTPNTSLLLNSNHTSFYSRTNQATATVHEIGCSITTNEFPNFVMILKYINGSAYFQTPDLTNRVIVANSNSTGYYIGTRTAVNSLSYYKNGSILGTNTGTHTQTQLPTVAAVISAYRFFAGISGYSSKEVSFATFGDGLTDTDAANLYTIVQKYQTTLGRQV